MKSQRCKRISSNIWTGGCRATPAIRPPCSSVPSDRRADLRSAGSGVAARSAGLDLSARAVLRRALPLLRLPHDGGPPLRADRGLCRTSGARNFAWSGASSTEPAVTQIHWGGGTPTILAPQDMLRLTCRAPGKFHDDARHRNGHRNRSPFADPRAHRRAGGHGGHARQPGRAGFRTSACNRPFGACRASNRPPARPIGLRQAGIAGINLDLMYGLPHQTVATITQPQHSARWRSLLTGSRCSAMPTCPG